MARQIARVIWVDKTELPREYRRFAACFCFMLFYTEFVLGGTQFWEAWHQRLDVNWSSQLELWTGLTQLGLACSAYLCGRSLWYGGRWARWWLGGTICLLSLELALRLDHGLSWYSTPARIWGGLFDLGWLLCPLPWLFVLVATLWLSLWSVPLLGSHLRRWVLIGLAWCIGSAAVPTSFNLGVVGYEWTFASPFAPAAAWSLLLLAMLALLLGSRRLRLVAIVAATAEVTIAVFYAYYGVARLVAAAIGSLFATVSPKRGPLPSPFSLGCYLLNKYTFQGLLVDLVLQAGPWILIAIYARRYPMRIPPDDGSPWPRRYCEACGYNIHGITANICPECGSELQ